MSRTTVYKARKHSRLSIMAFLVLSLVSIGGLALWRLQSVQVMSVESASMSPNIRRGDAVVLRPAKPSALHVGDVVSYRSPADQGVIITHRIIEVESTWGQVVTKGDNATRNDKPVAMSEIIGKVSARVSYLGFVLDFFRSPAGLIVFVYLPALTIVILELKRLALHYARPTYRLLAYAKH